MNSMRRCLAAVVYNHWFIVKLCHQVDVLKTEQTPNFDLSNFDRLSSARQIDVIRDITRTNNRRYTRALAKLVEVYDKPFQVSHQFNSINFNFKILWENHVARRVLHLIRKSPEADVVLEKITGNYTDQYFPEFVIVRDTCRNRVQPMDLIHKEVLEELSSFQRFYSLTSQVEKSRAYVDNNFELHADNLVIRFDNPRWDEDLFHCDRIWVEESEKAKKQRKIAEKLSEKSGKNPVPGEEEKMPGLRPADIQRVSPEVDF